MDATDRDDAPVQAESAGIRFSEWLSKAPIGRTTAKQLIKGLAITPDRISMPGLSAKVAWLRPEEQRILDQAAAQIKLNKSVSQVIAEAKGGETAPLPAAPSRNPIAASQQDGLLRLLAAMGPSPAPSPLARARAMRDAAAEGLLLTAEELAGLTGRNRDAIDRMRSGSKLMGYRVWKVPGGSADPEPVFRLVAATQMRPIATADPQS